MEDGKLGKYEIRATLGRGAMGVVYEGFDPAIARKVAIKTVKRPDPQDAEAADEFARFKREAQAAGRLAHPNIVGVFDYGETDEIAYIVMEFIDGESLKAKLDRHERLPLSETVRVMGELLAGLQFSHERGVVHRDIKPANIMLTADGRVKIADFGIARIESSSMTQAGAVLGTPAYMSPEQFMGQTVDARTDIYSAGVVLFQLLTGERPFEGSMTSIMHKALNTAPPRPSELSVTAPGGLDPVVVKAMAKRPEGRYASAAEFARAIHTGATAPDAAPPGAEAATDATIIAPRATPRPAPAPAEAPRPTSPPPGGRSPMPLIAAAVAAVVVIAGGAWFALGPSPSPKPVIPVIPAVPAQPAPAPKPTPAPPKPQPTPPPKPAPAPTPTPKPTPQPAPAPTPQPKPTPKPAPAPRPTPKPTPPPPKPSTPGRAAVEQSARAVIASLGCALLQAHYDPATATLGVAGIVGRKRPEERLRARLPAALPTVTITWDLTAVTYCPALSTLHPLADPFAAPAARLALALAGGAHRLADGQLIEPQLTLPDYSAYLEVDYLSSDHSVYHLHPTPTDADRLFAAGAHVTLGTPAPGFQGWTAGTPYGRDMIIAIASSTPLFAKLRPQSEAAQVYIPALAKAIAAAKARGAHLAVAAITLDTYK